jgi:hypothetical protein
VNNVVIFLSAHGINALLKKSEYPSSPKNPAITMTPKPVPLKLEEPIRMGKGLAHSAERHGLELRDRHWDQYSRTANH